ncbi:unnamed protein product [Haemonchus placei]|uniref:DUF4604 domain-containing protein n=1 Tax=Haemonchus placei TaxID=6290 RepID=A0A0N4W3P0_HAEPC|nr:unnamed protein product [Haemonchus placei]
MKRMAHPSKNLEDVGFFTPDGEVQLEFEDPVDNRTMKVEAVEDEDNIDTETTSMPSVGDAAVKSDETIKKEKKPTYYELLQQRMRQREAQAAGGEEDQVQDKKPRLE